MIIIEDGHYDKSDGKRYKYKVVWWEDEEGEKVQPLTALGSGWYVTGSAIVFQGKLGDIVFSPSVKMIIK